MDEMKQKENAYSSERAPIAPVNVTSGSERSTLVRRKHGGRRDQVAQ